MTPLHRLLIPGLICLTACAPDHSEPTAAMSLCPAAVDYGTEFQRELADELETLPAHSTVWRIMLDYGQLRAALREC